MSTRALQRCGQDHRVLVVVSGVDGGKQAILAQVAVVHPSTVFRTRNNMRVPVDSQAYSTQAETRQHGDTCARSVIHHNRTRRSVALDQLTENLRAHLAHSPHFALVVLQAFIPRWSLHLMEIVVLGALQVFLTSDPRPSRTAVELGALVSDDPRINRAS